jgi:tetratricopeptide (TPR) repeat protein
MKRIRSSSLRASRIHGAGILVAAILAANGLISPAEAQSKKPSSAPKSQTKEATKPKGVRPSSSEDLYEGPGIEEPPAQPVKKPTATQSAFPVAPIAPAPTAPTPPVAPVVKAHMPRNADAWPSEYRPAAADLLPSTRDENKAAAIAAFAEAQLFEERGLAEKALRSYKKAALLDPADPRLATIVARELLKTNDPTAAIQVLKDSIAASPKEPKTYIYLARIYNEQLTKPDLAKQFADKAVEVAPDYFPAWKALLDFSATDGSGKKTEDLIARAMKSPAKDPDFWLNFAVFLRKNSGLESRKVPGEDDKKRIEAAYRKALDIAPQSASALAQYGDYFVLLRDYKKAISYFEQAKMLNQPPTHPSLENLREKLATALVADGRKQEALPMLERLASDFPARADLGLMLAEVYEQTGQSDKALDYYKRSLSLDLTSPDNHISLAESLIRSKKFDQAVAIMQEARSKFPDKPHVSYSLARCLSLAKKHQLAMDMFAAAQKEMKGRHEDLANGAFFFSYGAAAEQAGQFEKAAELLKKAIELTPDEPQAYNYLGYMWADRGENLEEAGTLIKKAVEIEPESAAYLDSLGWWYFKTGKFEEAKKELSRANEIMSTAGEEDATLLDHLADTMDKLGRRDEALKLWKRALKLESDIQEKLTQKIAEAEKK